MEKLRPRGRVTSLALESPEGHMSSSFLALSCEDSTQQPLGSTHSWLLYSGKGQLTQSVIFPTSALFFHCPWNLPKATLPLTPVPVPPPPERKGGAPIEVPQTSLPPLDGAGGQPSLNQGLTLTFGAPCLIKTMAPAVLLPSHPQAQGQHPSPPLYRASPLPCGTLRR